MAQRKSEREKYKLPRNEFIAIVFSLAVALAFGLLLF